MVDEEDAVFLELHGQRRDDRLGLGVHAEERVEGERGFALDVEAAVDAGVRDLAVAQHDGHYAGDLSAVNGLCHRGVDPREARRIESHILRDRHWQAGKLRHSSPRLSPAQSRRGRSNAQSR